MSEKSLIAILAAAMSAVLCFSLFIAMHDSNDSSDDVIMVINTNPVTEASSPSIESSVNDKTKNTSDVTETNSETTSSSNAEINTAEATEQLWLDINSASVDELTKLEGIGETLAERIVEYRENNGGFNNIEEIMNVKGIGEKKFQLIQDCIYVLNPTYDNYNDIETVIDESPPEYEAEESVEFFEESVEKDSDYAEISEENIIEEENLPTAETTHETTLEEAAPININEADVDELMLLPHVTEEIAERIIELRINLKGYQHPYELLYIEELEQNEVAEIVEFVTVGQ